ncbi:MAG: DoxX family protein [Myxococcota bacterium]|nr:DoxX family protein [Myxococcota bacterium]
MNPLSILRRVLDLARQLLPLQGYWIALVRFAIGVFFCITGATKLFDAASRAEMVQTLIASGIPFPEVNAVFISVVEFAGGGLLAIGLLTPICAVLLGGDMLVAIFTDRIKSVQGDTFFAWLDNFLYLPEVLYALILGWLLISGAGKLSLDGLLAPSDSDKA